MEQLRIEQMEHLANFERQEDANLAEQAQAKIDKVNNRRP